MAIAANNGIDLSRLPPPAVIEDLSFEAIYAEALADFLQRYPEFTAAIESEPVVKLAEVFAYRELVIRQRVNDAAHAVMIAYALGSDLDALGALVGVERFELSPGDPAHGVAPVYEEDDDYRRRIVLAPQGFSVAGPEGAYVFHALSADPDVRDATAISPAPGQVLVTVQSRSGDGAASAALLATVDSALSAATVRPLTDQVLVQAAAILPFTIDATLVFLPGPDHSVVLALVRDRLTRYLAATQTLGRSITRATLIAALCPDGVENVLLHEPAADIVPTAQEAAYCTGVTLTDGGVAW